MILSHKYKFLFIKTAKTAGTSIEVFLSQCCGPDDVLTPVYPPVEPHVARNYRGFWNPFREIAANHCHGLGQTMKDLVKRNRFYNHIPAQTAKHRLRPGMWRDYLKFCVERNPWDKTLSHYHMVNQRAGGKVTFEEYLERGQFCLNHPKYTDSTGTVIVDKIIRYESLINELSEVFKRLGIPFSGTLGVRAKSDSRKDRRAYQEVYSDQQKQVIETAFAKEIELHGYAF
jgi:hypothetical protein